MSSLNHRRRIQQLALEYKEINPEWRDQDAEKAAEHDLEERESKFIEYIVLGLLVLGTLLLSTAFWYWFNIGAGLFILAVGMIIGGIIASSIITQRLRQRSRW